MSIIKNIMDKIYPYIEPYIIKANSITVHPADLFFSQTKDGLFRRPDMIVRYLFIENYFGKNSFGKELYQKMQTARISETSEPVERFNALISSYEKNGYNPQSYIFVKQNLSIRNGSHRSALALYYNTPLTCFMEKDNSIVKYEYDWFRDNGFSEAEIKTISDKADELYSEFNQPLNIFIFDNAVKRTDDVCRLLENFGSVENIRRYNFSKEQTAEALKNNGVTSGEKTLAKMCRCHRKIAVVSLAISQPEIIYSPKDRQVFIKQCQKIYSSLNSTMGKELLSLTVIPNNFGENTFFLKTAEKLADI